MRIASWNINSLRKRQDRLLEWLTATHPDIVCLQETKCTDEQFPELALRAAGYHSAFHGQKSYNGVAILSKTNHAMCARRLCDEVEDPQARVIAVTIGDVRVFSVYAPNGQAVGSPAYEYKLKWYARLRECLERDEHWRETGQSAAISMSRRKMKTFTTRILWRGAIMCSDGERAAFQQVVRNRFDRHSALASSRSGLFSAGGIIGCSRSQRIADCASTAILASTSLAARCTVLALIVRCARERIRPITRRSGQSLMLYAASRAS